MEHNGQNSSRAAVVFDSAELAPLFDLLQQRGYQIIGPTLRDNAIIFDELTTASQLPQGWADWQEAGRYCVHASGDAGIFNYRGCPQSWKPFLHQPHVSLFTAARDGNGFTIDSKPPQSTKRAFVGVRPCDLRAIAIQDTVFLDSGFVDPHYAAQRADTLIVAVNCGQAGNTCFCTSMNSGPRAREGYDIALTELLDADGHRFVADCGSEAGAEILAALTTTSADPDTLAAVEATIAEAASQMGRTLDTDGLKELLYANYEHPRWAAVANRCLSCANCTMVCPTCFCTSVEDVTDLTGDSAERVRVWDSCFTNDFSYIHGGSVRPNTRSRYRQWMTHKLATWYDQFGSSGCVGCGRCITWCPAAIDITEEMALIRASSEEPHHAH
jgi:ferredoxin